MTKVIIRAKSSVRAVVNTAKTHHWKWIDTEKTSLNLPLVCIEEKIQDRKNGAEKFWHASLVRLIWFCIYMSLLGADFIPTGHYISQLPG